MKKIKTRDTAVLSCVRRTGADGRVWTEAEIAWEKMEFVPGQYVMAAEKKNAVSWPSPLMIQKKTERGFTVIIHENSPLKNVRETEGITVWGPSGTGPDLTSVCDFVLVSDRAGLILNLPFLYGKPEACKGIYMVGACGVQNCEPWLNLCKKSGIPVFDGMTPEDILKEEALKKTELILAALPLPLVSVWSHAGREELAEKTRIFTGVKIGCGIGACRGCYIHTKENPQGTAVCQEGPYLQMSAVNYEQDQNFLTHFI